MLTYQKNRSSSSGFTLVELLLTLLLTGIVTTAAMSFYISEHKSSLTQEGVSTMQQNLRASFDAVARSVTNAGANLPSGLQALMGADANPDTLTVRFAPMGSSVSVGDATTKDAASPIHVSAGTNLSALAVGDQVYYWHTAQQQGSWFTISGFSINNGTGWDFIYHTGTVLLFDPAPGDDVIKMTSMKYYLNTADSANPLLMLQKNSSAPIVFADDITDFQIDYYLTTSDTVQTLTPVDTVTMIRLTMSAQTAGLDYDALDQGLSGKRFRTLSTEVAIRNNRN